MSTYRRFSWNILCGLCIVCYLQCGQTLEPKATFDEYEKGLRGIVSEFLPHTDNHNDDIKNRILSSVLTDKVQKRNETTNSHHSVDKEDRSNHSNNGGLFSKFPCYRMAPSKKKPRSVHALRPGDIDVVAAIGDSLTAGKASGSEGVTAVLFDYRGLSWSIGGDGTFDTLHSLPNILREYNPDLYGFSNSIGNLMSQTARLNVAKSGATSGNLAFQSSLLIQRLKNDPLVDFEKDWKVVTILIGANDLCRSCKAKYTPQTYINRLKSALDILHDSVPRMFVNLVEVMPVELTRFLPRDAFCRRIETFYCGCAVDPKSESQYYRLIYNRKEFQRLTEKLVSSGVYDDREDFTVVLQPFYKNFSLQMIPGTDDIDYSIFAVDCFHPSMKGQSRGGLGLWNNMLQPVGHKTNDWSITESMLCPTEAHPFLATAKNSIMLRRKYRGLKKYNWLKKASSSIKKLQHRHRKHLKSHTRLSLNDIRGDKRVDEYTENKAAEELYNIITPNSPNHSFKSSPLSHANDSSPASNTNSSSGDTMVLRIWLDDPEPWEIWSIVLGWTLLMSTALVYCVTIKNARNKGKSSPPTAVVKHITDNNKH